MVWREGGRATRRPEQSGLDEPPVVRAGTHGPDLVPGVLGVGLGAFEVFALYRGRARFPAALMGRVRAGVRDLLGSAAANAIHRSTPPSSTSMSWMWRSASSMRRFSAPRPPGVRSGPVGRRVSGGRRCRPWRAAIGSVMAGALRTRFRLAHSLRYSASIPRASVVPGRRSSGIHVRTPDMYVRMVFGAISRAMRPATHSTYVAVVQGRATSLPRSPRGSRGRAVGRSRQAPPGERTETRAAVIWVNDGLFSITITAGSDYSVESADRSNSLARSHGPRRLPPHRHPHRTRERPDPDPRFYGHVRTGRPPSAGRCLPAG